jgi:hypothetical protein
LEHGSACPAQEADPQQSDLSWDLMGSPASTNALLDESDSYRRGATLVRDRQSYGGSRWALLEVKTGYAEADFMSNPGKPDSEPGLIICVLSATRKVRLVSSVTSELPVTRDETTCLVIGPHQPSLAYGADRNFDQGKGIRGNRTIANKVTSTQCLLPPGTRRFSSSDQFRTMLMFCCCCVLLAWRK